MRILLVEDGNMLGQRPRQALTEHGPTVDCVKDGDRTPMLVLTARDGVDDRVAGLDVGADVIRNVRGLGWHVSKGASSESTRCANN